MGDRDYVLPATTVRNLNDKLYEKRKAAALEIERMVKGRLGQIFKFVFRMSIGRDIY